MIKLMQGSEAWKEFRKNKIGASDAPIIIGVSPWMTKHQLWEEKLGLREPQQTTSAMSRGTELEARAREIYIDHMGIYIEPVVLIHPENQWMMASLDGLSKCGLYACEIKCPGKKDHMVAKAGLIPEKYYPQLQHIIEVKGLKSMHYMSYYKEDEEEDFVIINVDRDDAYIESLIKLEKVFWNQLQNFEEPELGDKDYVQREDAQWADAANKYLIAKDELCRAQEMEEYWHDELIRLANGKSSKGHGIGVSKIVKKGAVDYSKIKELENVDLNQYRKKNITYWRISI